jgi:hypothetical protein
MSIGAGFTKEGRCGRELRMARRAWLNPHEVRAIRRLRRDGHKITVIANALGLGASTVSAVANNKTHTDVPDTSSTPHPWDTLAVEHIYQHRQAAAATRKKSPVSQRLRGGL